MTETSCPVCGATFTPREARIKACSPRCGYILRGRKQEKAAADKPTELHEHKGDQWNISLPAQGRIKSLDALLEYCEVDLAEWAVDRYIVNKWEVGAKNPTTGEILVEPLFQIKAWLKRKTETATARSEIEDMKARAKTWAPRLRAPAVKRAKSGLLAEIDITDHHFGALALGRETGWEDHDLKKAEASYVECFSSLLDRVSLMGLDRILYVVGNDMLHADNRAGTTEHGTAQDIDTRYQKTFTVVREVVTDCIERAMAVAPVDVLVMPGNHDQLGAWHLGDSLHCWFRNTDRVSVNNEERPRKYFEWGRVLLGFAHGKYLKRDGENMGLLMAAEQPEAFGRTLYREFHVGHLHQLRTKELHGVRVRVLSTLTPATAWASELGYVGNLRSSEAFVWHKDRGLDATVYHNIPPAPRQLKGAAA